jgi:hypothetical protein
MKDWLFDNKYFYDYTYRGLKTLSLLSKLFVAFFIIGVIYAKFSFTEFFKSRFTEFASTIKIIVAFLLLYRFNPYRKYKIRFTDLDRKIAYSTGMFLILITFSELIIYYSDAIHSVVSPYTTLLVNNLYKTWSSITIGLPQKSINTKSL